MIELSRLQMTYQTPERPITVVDIPAWRVDRGEQIAIFGSSGSGKSTLLHILAGVLRPTAGSARVCGSEIATMSEVERDRFRARHVGYVFQNFNLLQGYTAVENVLMGTAFSRRAAAGRERAKALLDTVGLSHRADHKPAQLSLGEQQRVAIARTVAKSPELILADEPTGSLDPRNTTQIVDLLRSTCDDLGATLILVTHETSVIERFEQTLHFSELNCAWSSADTVS